MIVGKLVISGMSNELIVNREIDLWVKDIQKNAELRAMLGGVIKESLTSILVDLLSDESLTRREICTKTSLGKHLKNIVITFGKQNKRLESIFKRISLWC